MCATARRPETGAAALTVDDRSDIVVVAKRHDAGGGWRDAPLAAATATDAVPGLTVAVCTYLRPEAVARLLSALAGQAHPIAALVVVDASPDARTEAAVLGHPIWAQGGEGWYVRVGAAGRGLPRQRNLALDLVATDLVAFFDDDVVPLPECLAALEGALRAAPELIGAGATLLPAPGQQEPSNVGARMRLRQVLRIVPSLEPGRYHRTGISTVWDSAALRSPVTVGDWLPGYAAMWRADVAKVVRYADDFAGYAQGEDLEFSLRAGRRGKLAMVTDAVVQDHHDPAGRPDHFELGYMAVRNRLEIHRRGLPDRRRRDVALFAYAWTLDSLLVLLGGLRPASSRRCLAHVAGRAAGAWDAARGRPLRVRRRTAASTGGTEPASSSLCVVAGTPLWRDADTGRVMGIGGFPLQMGALAQEFEALTIIGPDRGPLPGGIALPASVELVGVREPAGRGLIRKLSLVATLPRYLVPMVRTIRRHDAVHVPLPGDLPLVGLLVARSLRKPIVARWCSSWEDNAHTTRMNRLVKVLLRRWARRGRAVVLATGLGSEPAAPGIPWIASTPLTVRELVANRADLDRPLADPAQLAFVGRLAPEKGVDVLLLAVAKLRADGRGVELRVIGDGPARAELETRTAELHLGGSVCFTGRLGRDDLNAQLAEADLAVQPSYSEGLSKAWLDALANGVPVVASTAGGMAEPLLAADAVGWTVPPGDADRVAGTVAHVLDSVDDWPQLRHRCRHAAERHTLEQWAASVAGHCRRGWQAAGAGGAR